MMRTIRGLCKFFFQAEDGIRDIGVTGVQTCALPIWRDQKNDWTRGRAITRGLFESLQRKVCPTLHVVHTGAVKPIAVEADRRSEERRVGKESRYRWSPYH